MPVNYKYFVDPFATGGDRSAVPDGVQIDGSVSYTQGYGPDYSLDPQSDPDAILVGRQQFNEVMYQITQALAFLQTDFPEFVSAADNGGTNFPYKNGAVVRFTDGFLYQNTVAANTGIPPGNGWVIFLSQYATAAALAAEVARAEAAEGLLAPLASPNFGGTPTAPTPTPGTGGNLLATCAYVLGAVQSEANRAMSVEATKAPNDSPNFTGSATVPNQSPGNSTTVIANTAFVTAAVAATLATALAATAAETTRAEAAEAALAPINSPSFSGNPRVPNQSAGNNSTLAANTAFVTAAVLVETTRALAAEAALAPINSPTFTGTVTLPSTPPSSNDNTAATSAWVRSLLPSLSSPAIRYAVVNVPIGGSFAIASFSWNVPFGTSCLAAVASAHNNDVLVPGAAGNNFVAIALNSANAGNSLPDMNGGTVRIDTEQGRTVTGNIRVSIIGIGV